MYRELTDWRYGIVKHEPYSGRLDSTEMEHLSTLLADQNLISVKSGFKGGLWFGTPSEGQLDTLTVLINRGSGKQFLLVSSASAHIMPAEILPVYTTPKIKPLLNRYERMTKRKSNPDPNITLDCSKRWE